MNRQTLRREIAGEGYLNILVSSTTDTGSSTTNTVYSTNLIGRKASEMVGSNLSVTDQTVNEVVQERIIISFDEISGGMTVDKPLSGSPASGDILEIYTKLNKTIINNAINLCINRFKNRLTNHKYDRTTVLGRKLLGSSASVATSTASSYTAITGKQVIIGKAGDYYVTFEHKTNSARYVSFARIYVNTVATGTERSTIHDGYDFIPEEKITVAAGDQINLYGKIASGGTTSVQNLQVFEAVDNLESYPIPSGFNFIARLMVENATDIFDKEIPSHMWDINKINDSSFLKILDSSPNNFSGRRLELVGASYPSTMTLDSTTSPIPDDFSIPWVSWYLTNSRLSSDSESAGWLSRAKVWSEDYRIALSEIATPVIAGWKRVL